MAQGEGGGYMSFLKNKISKKLNLSFHSERLVGWLVGCENFYTTSEAKEAFFPADACYNSFFGGFSSFLGHVFPVCRLPGAQNYYGNPKNPI